MNSLVSLFFFVLACVTAYEAYRSFRGGTLGTQQDALSPANGAKADSGWLGGALWGAIALVSALAAFYFDWLAGFDFDWLPLPPR
jgi:hypothetical protein